MNIYKHNLAWREAADRKREKINRTLTFLPCPENVHGNAKKTWKLRKRTCIKIHKMYAHKAGNFRLVLARS